MRSVKPEVIFPVWFFALDSFLVRKSNRISAVKQLEMVVSNRIRPELRLFFFGFPGWLDRSSGCFCCCCCCCCWTFQNKENQRKANVGSRLILFYAEHKFTGRIFVLCNGIGQRRLIEAAIRDFSNAHWLLVPKWRHCRPMNVAPDRSSFSERSGLCLRGGQVEIVSIVHRLATLIGRRRRRPMSVAYSPAGSVARRESGGVRDGFTREIEPSKFVEEESGRCAWGYRRIAAPPCRFFVSRGCAVSWNTQQN